MFKKEKLKDPKEVKYASPDKRVEAIEPEPNNKEQEKRVFELTKQLIGYVAEAEFDKLEILTAFELAHKWLNAKLEVENIEKETGVKNG